MIIKKHPKLKSGIQRVTLTPQDAGDKRMLKEFLATVKENNEVPVPTAKKKGIPKKAPKKAAKKKAELKVA